MFAWKGPLNPELTAQIAATKQVIYDAFKTAVAGGMHTEIQSHLFQTLCNLAMEPPVRTDSETILDEKVKGLQAVPPLEAANLVRGQFRSYREDKGARPDSKLETFAPLRLEVDSWRWKGVPFYIRAGKNLPLTCTGPSAGFESLQWSSKRVLCPGTICGFESVPR